MNKKSIIILVVVLVLAGILIAVYYNREDYYSGAKSTPTASSTVSPVSNNIITIQNFAFSPSVLEIKAGQKVTWKQNDSAPHSIVSSDNLFTSSVLDKGGEFSFTFNGVGEYGYHCGIHPSMTGKIIVK